MHALNLWTRMHGRVARHAYFRFLNYFVMAAMFASAVSGAALAQGSPTLRSKAASADALPAKATRAGSVRVILTLTGASRGAQSFPPKSSSTRQPSSPDRRGPLGDGQAATVEQERILSTHVGDDETKRQRWSPRLIRNSPYMAVTVTQAELEELAADSVVVRIHEVGQLQPQSGQLQPLR